MNDPKTADPNIAKYEATLVKLTARADKGDRQKFLETYHQIRKFADEDDYGSMYENVASLNSGTDTVFKAAVNRAAEYRDVFGSFLYPQNPVSNVVPNAPVDTWTLRRFNLEVQVLDYTMRQNDDEKHLRKSLAEGLLSGRGMVWYGFNARKNVPSISFDSVDNFAIDPDARSPEDVNWIRRDGAEHGVHRLGNPEGGAGRRTHQVPGVLLPRRPAQLLPGHGVHGNRRGR